MVICDPAIVCRRNVILRGYLASVARPYAQYLIHDMRFHQTIAAASGNRILTSLMNMLATLLLDVRSKTVNRARDLKESAEMHRNIYSAIRRREVAAASAAMRDHLLLAEKAQADEENESISTPNIKSHAR